MPVRAAYRQGPMETRRTTRLLCIADPRGDGGAITRVVEQCHDRDIQGLAVVGDLAGPGAPVKGFRQVFHALGQTGLTAFWVPGSRDAPIQGYLHEAYNTEMVFPSLHGVHGTAALAPDGHVLVAGLGGAVDDDPDATRDETNELRYPRWEPEYRLKVLREFDEHEMLLLFSTPPAHKGHPGGGSEVLAELINTWRPRIVVCGGPRRSETLGKSLVVSPGPLAEGCYAIADFQTREAELETLGAVVR